MSDKPSDNESVPPKDLTNVDLYCLHCGYNLRGLSGDPRRCPECGQFSPLSELTLPAEAITRQLERMETAPTACVGLTLLILTILLAGVLVMITERPTAAGFMCCIVLMTPVLALWVASMERFRSACLNKPGWRAVLFDYHVQGLGLCLLMLTCVILPFVAFLRLGASDRDGFVLACLTVVFIGGCAAVVVLAPRIRRRIKARMDVLQREVAVKMAGEHLRQRLSKPRR